MDSRMKAQEVANNIKEGMVGCRYRHFKGAIYIVTDIAVHSETEEIFVVYKSFDRPFLTWVRPIDMFISEVDREKYPDVEQRMRFERIDRADD